jgi:hypothetical protein
MGPAWLVGALAAVMLVTAAYCFGRLVAAEMWHRTTHSDVDVGHVAMGVAMAGMLEVSLRTLPSGVWEVIFGCLSAWFVVQIVRFVSRWGVRGWDDDHLHHASHYVTHLAMALAMLYMFFDPSMSRMALSTSDDMAAMGSAPSSATASGVPLVLAFILLVAAVWYADSLTRFVRKAAGAGGQRAVQGRPDEGTQTDAGGVTMEETIRASKGDVETEVATRRRLAVGSGQVLSCTDGRWLAPRLEIATHIAMCVTMAYMLVLLR